MSFPCSKRRLRTDNETCSPEPEVVSSVATSPCRIPVGTVSARMAPCWAVVPCLLSGRYSSNRPLRYAVSYPCPVSTTSREYRPRNRDEAEDHGTGHDNAQLMVHPNAGRQ